MNKNVYYNLNQDIKDLEQARLEINWVIARADKLQNVRDFGRCLTCDYPLDNTLHVLCDDCFNDKNRI